MSGEVILYQTEDGAAQISLRAMDGTVWLTQAEMAALFDTAPQAITQLIKTIYADGELTAGATCKELLQVRLEGTRQVERKLKSYSLPMIMAVVSASARRAGCSSGAGRAASCRTIWSRALRWTTQS